MSTGNGNIILKYKNSLGTKIHSDKIKYTFIAADCDRQPKTDDGERAWGNSLSNNHLIHCEWSITGEPTPVYNCIAWSVGISDRWFNKVIEHPPGSGQYHEEIYAIIEGYVVHIVSIDKKYGDGNNVYEISDLDTFYLTEANYTPTASGASDAQAIYYSGYHGAKRKGCGCGAGKWQMFESKCGGAYKIEHVYDQIDGGYGSPQRFYK